MEILISMYIMTQWGLTWSKGDCPHDWGTLLRYKVRYWETYRRYFQ